MESFILVINITFSETLLSNTYRMKGPILGAELHTLSLLLLTCPIIHH